MASRPVSKGSLRWDFVNSSDRLTKPLIREGDKFREASWDEALDLVARRLTEIKAKHGPDALAFISSSKCTNEESYLMQKLARAVIGTNNMDNCSRYCQSPATVGLFRTVGYGGDSGSITDIEKASLVHHHRQQHGGEPSGPGDARQAGPQIARPKAHRLRSARERDGKARRCFPAPQARNRPGLAFGDQPLSSWRMAWRRSNFLKQWVNGLEEYQEES